MSSLLKSNLLKRRVPSSLLGLALDGSRLEGVVLRRTNGSLRVVQRFAATLSLDPLTNDTELVGREILNHLEAAGVRERRCVVGLPLKWALTAHTKVPSLPDADIAAFLSIEAERGFATDAHTLNVAISRFTSPSGEQQTTFVGVPKSHVERLELVLRAAKLKPASFSLGITALQPPADESSNGVLALAIRESQVGLQISSGGGVAALRSLEAAVETGDPEQTLPADLVARETRITLGQLPPDVRKTVSRLRVFGPPARAQQLADALRPHFAPAGITVQAVTAYSPGELGAVPPADAPVCPAFSLAARRLAERPNPFEFLPPKLSAWEQLTARHGSRKLRAAAAVVAALAILTAGAFAFQGWRLARLRSQWSALSPKVKELSEIQDRIQQYRPWSDHSFRYLTALKQLTSAFPEDGSLTAKTVEIREMQDVRNVSVVSCSGNAASYAALQKTVHQLGAIRGISDLNVPTRGKSPIQFTFDFHLNPGPGNEN